MEDEFLVQEIPGTMKDSTRRNFHLATMYILTGLGLFSGHRAGMNTLKKCCEGCINF